ncbi:ABC transporter ATP-binding protein [Lacticaseibacillus jixiensis]|uniref:ABC transporter ATP-binding protein n=1 Tax=Lacticaseibacillus jixiensis TaxID=3231926 RepID=UPI0036F35B2D
MASQVIEIKHLTKRYANERLVLDDISLSVAQNEFITVIGPSGCGKSTLLNIIAGLETATSGVVLDHGQPVAGTAPQRGVVFQQYALFPWLTVRENVAFGLKMQRRTSADVMAEVTRFIKMVGLADFADSYPKDLSGGMKQRVAIARAYAANPSLLLMDEPFGALDAQTRAQLQGELLNLWQQAQKTCFFITHDVDEAIILGQKIVVMGAHPGHIKAVIPVDLPYPRSVDTRLSEAFLQIKQQVWGLVYTDQEAAHD